MNPPTIGIDARLYGLKHAGIGRYVQNLISQLGRLGTGLNFTLFVHPQNPVSPLPDNFTLVSTPVRHYSLQEQLLLPRILNRHPCDLYHFPHFNVPLVFSRPFIVTIHDLLWHQKIGLKATTLNPLLYFAKYAGYRRTIRHAATRSRHILAPSRYVRSQIHSVFSRPYSDITVTYEAAEPAFFRRPANPHPATGYGLKLPFIVYTGSLYPHKNVDNLILALKSLPQVQLAIVSARNVFAAKTQRFVAKQCLTSRVKFLGFVPDADLASLYRQALVLVQPSESEGFGLTGLEAMASGLPVICSQNPVLQEIYGSQAIYVNTQKPAAIARAVRDLLHQPAGVKSSRLRLQKHAKQYSWTKLARQTLQVYRQNLPQ